ncbi:MAG: glycosyltransferase family 4 protein [Gammaproteobacteria bacterium]|nr:glycosyltransferase family 4 protein [Gammaproteobacteria bacterium]
MAPKLLFVVTEDWYFRSHRLPLAQAAQAAGYEVHVATRIGRDGERIRQAGFVLHPLPFSRSPRRPWRDAATLVALIRLYRRLAPAAVHHVALKPVVLGSLAALVASPPLVVNALTGLGFVFASDSAGARALRVPVRALLRVLLRRPNAVTVLQNSDDLALLRSAGLVDPDRTVVVRGSGVDLALFAPAMATPGPPVIVCAARMLRDKGIVEFVEAARMLRRRAVDARCVLVGGPDPENPASLSEAELRAWDTAGVIEWWGVRDDMPAVFAQCQIACLPSYREGLPKVLLEAAAAGLPLVGADVPGCREIVRAGENGCLVPPRDPGALADALATLVGDAALRRRYGARSRELAADFSLARVNAATLAVYERFGRRAGTPR